jgi:signal transduction histidine kinase
VNAGPEAHEAFTWGESYKLETDIRARVLAERINWFITIRWVMAALCLIAALGAALGLLPRRIDWRLFVGVGLFLGAVNLVYRWATGRLLRRRRVMVAQVLTDFGALSALSYATGSIETPVPMFFLAHIILVSLFFPRALSLLLTAVALAFAVLPIVLEWAGLLPAVSLNDLKLVTAGEPARLALYGATLTGAFLFCWYLTSTITGSLTRRERQLEESHVMLERLDREKTQATLRATHELKAPFAAIKTYVYSLRDGYWGDLPPAARGAVQRIGDRCDRLTNMITAIIHVGNLRTAVVSDGDFEPVDLGQFLGPEIEEATVLAAPRQIALKATIPTDAALTIHASPRHLHTLVANLLGNAVAYSHDRGEVEVSLHAGKRNVVLRVSDHGIGIARENIPKIFDDFFRSNAAAQVNPQGNGLGLTLVREVAKLHGATVEVASQEGAGTCFWVWFPRSSTPTQGGSDGQGADHR